MGGKDANYQIIYRGEVLEFLRPGEWVFFQRRKDLGGGYWLGRTYTDFYHFGPEQPVSLSQGLLYIMASDKAEAVSQTFDDDFELCG
ncbi:TPA: hypothetical protein JLF94_002915 [Escherichia coli]|nr:hypothetical protein [Escherichia coli]HAV9341886.1 hypothetical protein [Escherichia coli]